MNLTDGLTDHLQHLTPPPPDLDRVVSRGRRLRRTRLAAEALAVVLVVGALGGTAVLLRGGDDAVSEPPIASAGPMDLSHGLRAYADPGHELRMGGRSFPAEDLAYLDTDAATTAYGLVFFRDGRPFLLDGDGHQKALWDGPVTAPDGWHPTAKADADGRHVAFAVTDGEKVTLVVADLATDGAVSMPSACADRQDCRRLVIDAIDSGKVFVRTSRGTYLWRYTAKDGDALDDFAGAKTRVADVRNKVILFDGPRPTLTLDGWTYVPGPIDAQLTLDGRNILSWSPTLAPSVRGFEPLRLDLPENAQFFTLDTDGSVLAATTGDPAQFFDCTVPSGDCEKIGTMRMTGGDPQFVGNDM